jgi:hypothetical protein
MNVLRFNIYSANECITLIIMMMNCDEKCEEEYGLCYPIVMIMI